MTFIKLVRMLEHDIHRRRRSRFDDAWLACIAELWRGFFTAKRDVTRRFDGHTLRAEANSSALPSDVESLQLCIRARLIAS